MSLKYTIRLSAAKNNYLLAALLATSLLAASCGGGGSSTLPISIKPQIAILDSFGQNVSSSDASGVGAGDAGADGTAGEGSPLPGATITIIDASGKTTNATADAKGYYRAKITGFTSPLVAKAELGAKKFFYSASIDNPKINGFITINVTGLTDKVVSDVAIAAGGTSSASITPATIAANKTALAKAKNDLRLALSAQLTVNGLSTSTFDPVTTPFRADHTGYDAVLDTTLVSRNGTGTTQITPGGQQYVVGLDTTGIPIVINEFNRLNATSTGRSSAEFADLVDASYLEGGENKTTFLSNFTSASSTNAGSSIVNAIVSNCVLNTAICRMVFDFVRPTGTLGRVDTQVKQTNGIWRIYGDQSPVAANFKSVLIKNLNYNSSNVATTTFLAGYNLDVNNNIYLSARLEYIVTVNGVAGSINPLMNVITKPGCTVGTMAIDDGVLSNCGNFVPRTDAQLIALNNSFSTGSVTLRITVYSGNNYTGTATTFIKPFTQVMYLGSQGASLVLPTVIPSGFTTGAVAFTVPADTYLRGVSMAVFKRFGAAVPVQTGFTFWEGGSALALNGTASMSAAELACGNCGSYTTSNFGQITKLNIDVTDSTQRGIRTSFSYPFLN